MQAPAIMKTRDPTARRNLILTKRSRCRTTRNNAPGAVPPITRDAGPTIIPDYVAQNHAATKLKLRRSLRLIGNTPAKKRVTFTSIHGPHTSRARSNIISQQALNTMMMKEALYPPSVFSPSNLILPAFVDKIPNYAHYASPMIHPTTGETITSYKRLMNNPETAEIWQTAFDKDFGGMAQGDNKTGQKGTNSIFVMEHDVTVKAKKNRKTFTYARTVVDYRPQKRGSKSPSNHSQRKPHQVQGGRINKNGGPDHMETSLEQRVEH